MAHNDKPHIAGIKTTLAEKYARLSTIAKSDAKRRQFARKAEKYRRQAAEVTPAAE